MILINFAHPLSDDQLNAIEGLCAAGISRVIAVPTQFEQARGYAEQTAELVDAAGLSATEWQAERLIVVPPSLAAIACLAVAEIHGRAGYFVPIVRMSPRPGSVPPVFDAVELLDLASQREVARARRSG